MAHITLPVDVPGIRGPLNFRPDAAKHLLGLAETILRQPASLEPGERETIAAWTSSLNGCRFCTKSHAAAARAWLGPERSVALDRLLEHEDASGFSPKLQALLALSKALQSCVLGVTPEHIERARTGILSSDGTLRSHGSARGQRDPATGRPTKPDVEARPCGTPRRQAGGRV